MCGVHMHLVPLCPLLSISQYLSLASNAKHDYSHNSSLHQIEIGSPCTLTHNRTSPLSLSCESLSLISKFGYLIFSSSKTEDLSLPSRNIDLSPATSKPTVLHSPPSPRDPCNSWGTSIPTRFLLDTHASAFDDSNTPLT